MLRKSAVLGMILVGLALGSGDAEAAGPVLEQVVILARHGIRPPTKSPEQMAKFSQQTWPIWSVPPGELTGHGAKMAKGMGAYLRAHYSGLGLFPAGACPEGLALWSDGADQRTRRSGEALAAGLAPGCGVVAEHGPAGATDPLFASDRLEGCRGDAEQARAAVLAAAGGDLDRPDDAYRDARTALQRILFAKTPASACAGRDDAACLLITGRNLAHSTPAGGVRLDGPLAAGATASESLLLEYAEGLPTGDVGWGRAASPKVLAAIMPMHDIYARLVRRPPYIGGRHSGLLAREIARRLRAGPAEGGRFTLFVGHDTNLANIAGLLGVDWTLPGQPDRTAPDTALAFEVWRSGDIRYLRLSVHYQTLAGLRAADMPDGDARTIKIALACGETPAPCELEPVLARMLAAVPASCQPGGLPLPADGTGTQAD